MGEIGEYWRAHREWSQSKRAQNRVQSAQILLDHGIDYLSRNDGAHLIIMQGSGAIADFWPGTGKWSIRGGSNGRGVFNLVEALEEFNGATDNNIPDTT